MLHFNGFRGGTRGWTSRGPTHVNFRLPQSFPTLLIIFRPSLFENPDFAPKWFDVIPPRGIEPNLVSYATLIGGLCRDKS